MVSNKNHRILLTRKLLYIMKYVQSPNCTFCGEEETISHMLCTCPESQSIIRQVIRYLREKNIDLTFIEELFIFNIGNTYSTAELQICIIIKHYIYTTKRLNQHLSLITLLRKINHLHRLEQHTAMKNNCLDKSEKKWSNCREFLHSIH